MYNCDDVTARWVRPHCGLSRLCVLCLVSCVMWTYQERDQSTYWSTFSSSSEPYYLSLKKWTAPLSLGKLTSRSLSSDRWFRRVGGGGRGGNGHHSQRAPDYHSHRWMDWSCPSLSFSLTLLFPLWLWSITRMRGEMERCALGQIFTWIRFDFCFAQNVFSLSHWSCKFVFTFSSYYYCFFFFFFFFSLSLSLTWLQYNWDASWMLIRVTSQRSSCVKWGWGRGRVPLAKLKRERERELT